MIVNGIPDVVEKEGEDEAYYLTILLQSSRQIEESISILNFFPPSSLLVPTHVGFEFKKLLFTIGLLCM